MFVRTVSVVNDYYFWGGMSCFSNEDFKVGSFKKKIDSFRRWSSVSLKRSPRVKAKTSSLSSDPEEPWLPDGHRKTLRPIVDSVFGQVAPSIPGSSSLPGVEVFLVKDASPCLPSTAVALRGRLRRRCV
ncbi:unnamed protein product [Boreogadus saida]